MIIISLINLKLNEKKITINIIVIIIFLTWNIPDEFKDFRLVPFALLHPFLHGGDYRVGLVLGAVLGRLFSRPCETHCSGGANPAHRSRGLRREGTPPCSQACHDHPQDPTRPDPNSQAISAPTPTSLGSDEVNALERRQPKQTWARRLLTKNNPKAIVSFD